MEMNVRGEYAWITYLQALAEHGKAAYFSLLYRYHFIRIGNGKSGSSKVFSHYL